MRYFTFPKTRVRALGALTAAVAAATVLGTAAPASASLSSANWSAVTLPNGYFIGGVAPVSCVPHTQFCMVAVSDSAAIRGPGHAGNAILVTTDSGHSWTGYNTLPAAFYEAFSISCSSTSFCGVAGEDIHGQPQVAFTTDGGQTWTDPTPASWENVDWIATSIDCVPASGCWLTGLNGPFDPNDLVYPILLETSNLGASWRNFSDLPGSRTTNPDTAYALQDISCVSAASCVAVSTADSANAVGSVLVTTNGGVTWARVPAPKINEFGSVSCVPGIGVPTCYATATTYNPQTGGDSVILMSHIGGLSWSVGQDFGEQDPFLGISCADASHCWASGNGYQNEALDGTADGGRSWSLVTSSQDNTGGGGISCLSVSVCVATTDNGLWVTSDDGGLAG